MCVCTGGGKLGANVHRLSQGIMCMCGWSDIWKSSPPSGRQLCQDLSRRYRTEKRYARTATETNSCEQVYEETAIS